jgi:hypothetical protein
MMDTVIIHYILLSVGCVCIGYTIKPTVKDVFLAMIGMLLIVVAYNFYSLGLV